MDPLSSPRPFRADLVDRRNQTLVKVAGDLDVNSTAEFLGTLKSARPLVPPVVVDMEDVTFLDSSGLRCLINLHRASVEDAASVVRLIGVQPAQHRVLELNGLVGMFDVTASRSPRIQDDT
jgi:anti-anti-sigma factor